MKILIEWLKFLKPEGAANQPEYELTQSYKDWEDDPALNVVTSLSPAEIAWNEMMKGDVPLGQTRQVLSTGVVIADGPGIPAEDNTVRVHQSIVDAVHLLDQLLNGTAWELDSNANRARSMWWSNTGLRRARARLAEAKERLGGRYNVEDL